MVGDGHNDKMTKKDFISKMGNLGVYCIIQFTNFCDKIVSTIPSKIRIYKDT